MKQRKKSMTLKKFLDHRTIRNIDRDDLCRYLREFFLTAYLRGLYSMYRGGEKQHMLDIASVMENDLFEAMFAAYDNDNRWYNQKDVDVFDRALRRLINFLGFSRAQSTICCQKFKEYMLSLDFNDHIDSLTQNYGVNEYD